MSYEYLKDGTPFKAEELNTRVSKVADAVNSLTESNLNTGALRHEHLPQLIGPGGLPPNLDGFNFTTPRFFDMDPTSNSTALVEGLDAELMTRDYGHTLGKDTAVNAFIVMFNGNIRRFYKRKDGVLRVLNDVDNEKTEDIVTCSFRVFADVSCPAMGIPLLRIRFGYSERASSPGYALFGTEAPAGDINRHPGSAFRTDDYSFRDVPIRTVILPSDIVKEIYGDVSDDALLDTITVLKFGIEASPTRCYNPMTVPAKGGYGAQVTKGNLTVIPIQASVTTTGV